jgi:hypothetical protein
LVPALRPGDDEAADEGRSVLEAADDAVASGDSDSWTALEGSGRGSPRDSDASEPAGDAGGSGSSDGGEASSSGEWDLGGDESTGLDAAVAHFVAWLDGAVASTLLLAKLSSRAGGGSGPKLKQPRARATKPPSESALVAQYYLSHPAAAAVFRGAVSQHDTKGPSFGAQFIRRFKWAS